LPLECLQFLNLPAAVGGLGGPDPQADHETIVVPETPVWSQVKFFVMTCFFFTVFIYFIYFFMYFICLYPDPSPFARSREFLNDVLLCFFGFLVFDTAPSAATSIASRQRRRRQTRTRNLNPAPTRAGRKGRNRRCRGAPRLPRPRRSRRRRRPPPPLRWRRLWRLRPRRTNKA
jgi:hypothetical protein